MLDKPGPPVGPQAILGGGRGTAFRQDRGLGRPFTGNCLRRFILSADRIVDAENILGISADRWIEFPRRTSDIGKFRLSPLQQTDGGRSFHGNIREEEPSGGFSAHCHLGG